MKDRVAIERMYDAERSLWYPSARLFRQSVRGRWSDVLERLTRHWTRKRNPNETGRCTGYFA